MQIRPFVVEVAQATLDDLRERLAHTGWADEVADAGWDDGANLAYMRELGEYWRTAFDWRAQERTMNALPHFRAEVDGTGVHVIHARGRGPAPIRLSARALTRVPRTRRRAGRSTGEVPRPPGRVLP
jgi:hypothetical protein